MKADGLPEGSVAWLHEAGRVFARYHLRSAFRIRVHGRERMPATGPVLVVANHSSMIEPQLIFGMLPRRSAFLVKAEMFGGIVGKFMRAIGQIPLKRGEVDRKPLMTAVGVLKDGGVIGIFPEGTRGAGDVGAAERGAAWLVRASGATVLPVATRGTRKPADGRRRFRPRVDILVGEPFTPKVGPGKTGLDQGTEELRGELAALVKTLDDWRTENGFVTP
ncbi:1-acyl-sn-glycerol-3-phosphate acyltransferase [Amycolatopsis sp. NBRC 101858]|uniref:lysophospholipid acyltransferase family protein n=1 Tax=Amycolatopsis sp. NBRC 101858 TaxID=3032200 RepID=UPI0024A0272A|nr:lysophospholipid acyltransferase family protein [Amycolatopsis sp. NBRC 101858]GLY38655.1 1-acyl-sn-glycerol-3-phosphate acyltransferase [Amycolatopsis sp. NBRC 101858]